MLIKTLVARQLLTSTHARTHTHTASGSSSGGSTTPSNPDDSSVSLAGSIGAGTGVAIALIIIALVVFVMIGVLIKRRRRRRVPNRQPNPVVFCSRSTAVTIVTAGAKDRASQPVQKPLSSAQNTGSQEPPALYPAVKAAYSPPSNPQQPPLPYPAGTVAEPEYPQYPVQCYTADSGQAGNPYPYNPVTACTLSS